MDQKPQRLKGWLEKEFPGAVVEYVIASGMHKFRINTTGLTYWLYSSREFVADHDPDQVILSANRAKNLEAFRASTRPMWFFLGEGEAREVDENFARGK